VSDRLRLAGRRHRRGQAHGGRGLEDAAARGAGGQVFRLAVVIVVVLHDLLLWRKKIDYLIFLPSGKEKSPSIRAKSDSDRLQLLNPA
jgi:hypothetical protein